MSEESSFGSVATKAPSGPVAPEEAGGHSSRAFIIAGAVAVVVLAAFGYILFGSGGGEPEATGAVPPAAQAPGQPTADPSTAPEATPPKATDTKGRNPFTPLVVPAPAEDATGADSGTGTSTGTDTSTGSGSGAAPTTPTTPTTPTGETVTVKLVSVKGTTVSTKVGNVNYTGLAAGDTFGTSFQVYAIFNDSCAGFLYGDDSFALCEGGSTTLTKH